MISEFRAKELLEKHLQAYKKLLKIEHWILRVKFERLDDGLLGECNCDGKYQDASIKFDLSQNDDEKEFIDTLQHELLHCVLADMDMIKEIGIAGLDNDKTGMFFNVFTHSLERSVRRVQRIIFGEHDDKEN